MVTPKLYVTSWKRYNRNGGLTGRWVDLTKFYNFDQFKDYIYNSVLADEDHPEILFADYEGMPEELYDENYFDDDRYALALLYFNMDEEEKDAFSAYLSHFGNDNPSAEDFEERYAGQFSDDKEFGEWLVENYGYPKDEDHSYFDEESYGRDEHINHYVELRGHYFYAV